MELHDFLTPVVDVEFPGASSPSVTDPWCSISSFVMDCFASPHGEALFNAISNSPNTITSKNIGPPAKPTNATTPESTPGSAALHLVSNLSDPRDPRSVRCQSASENSTTASVTSGSLTPSPSASASSSGACKCLQRGIFLLDDLESLLDNTGCRDPHAVQRLGELHSALGSHKEAVKYAASMVQCAACSSRAESRILLSLLADRLILLCEKIVAAYLDAVRTWDETTPLPPDLGFNSGTNNTSDTAPRGSGAPRNGGACSSSSSSASQQLLHTLFFGEYEIDSPDEWSMLMGNLIKLQLRALHSLVGSIARSNQTRIKLEDAAGKITSLLHSLQQRPFLSAR
ncbi:hypothetical protein C8A01DRAFT_40943 [Parachaetomium inaequale]|uniref:Uncharacterized protein n=1 Tax=Parachaetomium inaequale TaxID=2588326 RepID=A0AAN6P6K8_9PEZI|nr:hypothetical protein C8A01DRAFT_40943 [Parachaetomium inaequale]